MKIAKRAISMFVLLSLVFSICIGIACAYELIYYRWDSSNIRWYWGGQIFDLGTTTKNYYMTRWEDAISSWNDCNLDAGFTETTSNQYADFTVDVGYTQSTSSYGYTIYQGNDSTGYFSYCAAYLNMNNTTVGNPTSGNYLSIQSTAAHELGHVLGLDHVPAAQTSSLMCEARSRWLVYEPSSDDCDGVNYIY